MLQNYGKRQIKNILFLLWKWLHVKRREREGARERRGERGRDITRCLQTLTTRRREREREGRRKGGAEMIQSGFEHTRTGLFNSLPDAVWKSAHRRETKPSQSLSVSHILACTHIHTHQKSSYSDRCILFAVFHSLLYEQKVTKIELTVFNLAITDYISNQYNDYLEAWFKTHLIFESIKCKTTIHFSGDVFKVSLFVLPIQRRKARNKHWSRCLHCYKMT